MRHMKVTVIFLKITYFEVKAEKKALKKLNRTVIIGERG